MSTEQLNDMVEPAADAVPEVAATPEAPEIDLSAVPEKVRGHVDTERYTSDSDYKQAIEHGWKPKEVFLAEGGDEADWTGYKVFNKRHRDWELRKEQQNEIKEMKRNTDAILRTFEEEKQRAIQQALADRQAQLKAAIDDGDAARAVEIQREIDRTEAQQQPTTPVLEPLAIRDIRRKNAFLNESSGEYDKALSDEFIGIARQKAEAYYNAYGRKLSDYEIKVIAEEALDMVKDRAKPAVQPAKQPAKAPAAAKPANTASASDPRKKMSADQKKFYDRMLTLPNGKAIAENYIKQLNA